MGLLPAGNALPDRNRPKRNRRPRAQGDRLPQRPKSNIGSMILQPKVDDGERGVGYWEVFETRRRLKRLPDFVATEARISRNSRGWSSSVNSLAKLKAIHDQDTAHLDIGSHSVWIELPTLVRLSHLLAARMTTSNRLESAATRFYLPARYQTKRTVAPPIEVQGFAFSPASWPIRSSSTSLLRRQPRAHRRSGTGRRRHHTSPTNSDFRLMSWRARSRSAA